MAESGKTVKKKSNQAATRKIAAKKGVPAKKKSVSKKTTVKKKSVKRRITKKSPTRRRTAAAPRVSDAALNSISARERYEMIARMAYFRAEKRNFETGWELDDWYESERLVDEMLGKLNK